jgi:hypothetical protein
MHGQYVAIGSRISGSSNLSTRDNERVIFLAAV